MSDKPVTTLEQRIERVRRIGRILYRSYHGSAGLYGKELLDIFPEDKDQQDNSAFGCHHEKMPDGAECLRCGTKP